jgi:phage terminase small subunit
MNAKPPAAPRDLGPAGKRLWKVIAGRYIIEPHHEPLLLQACRAADTAEDCGARIKAEGLTVANARGEVRAHPLLSVQRDAQRVMGYTLRVLGVRDEEPRRPRG